GGCDRAVGDGHPHEVNRLACRDALVAGVPKCFLVVGDPPGTGVLAASRDEKAGLCLSEVFERLVFGTTEDCSPELLDLLDLRRIGDLDGLTHAAVGDQAV